MQIDFIWLKSLLPTARCWSDDISHYIWSGECSPFPPGLILRGTAGCACLLPPDPFPLSFLFYQTLSLLLSFSISWSSEWSRKADAADTATPQQSIFSWRTNLLPSPCRPIWVHVFPTSFQRIPKRNDFSLGSPMIPPDPVLWASDPTTRVFISDVFSKPTAQSNPNQQLAFVIKMIEVNRWAQSRRWQRRALGGWNPNISIRSSSKRPQLYRTPVSAFKEAGHTEFVIDVYFFLTTDALDPLVAV